jgi:soluble lytic murein transglycosylase-like protein
MIDKNLFSTLQKMPKAYKYAGLGVAVSLVIYFLSGRKTGSSTLRKQVDKSILLSPTDIARVKKGLANTEKWNAQINQASKLTGVDSKIIRAIMAIESNGNQFAKSFCCYGLMQMLPDTFASWVKLGNESQDKIISKYINPSLSLAQIKSAGLNDKVDGYLKIYNPELNVLVASIGIRSILDLAKKRTGNENLAHLAIAYNAGSGALNKHIINKGHTNSDSATIQKVFPYTETKNYIKLLVGKDGALDQQTK